jgi:hypothetical protein
MTNVFRADELRRVPGEHTNVLDVEFRPTESVPMEIVTPMRLEHGCYQELKLREKVRVQMN